MDDVLVKEKAHYARGLKPTKRQRLTREWEIVGLHM